MSGTSATEQGNVFSQAAWVTYTSGWLSGFVLLSLGALVYVVGFAFGLSGMAVSTAPMQLEIGWQMWAGALISVLGGIVAVHGISTLAGMWMTRRRIMAATEVSSE